MKKQEKSQIQQFIEDYNLDPIFFGIALIVTFAVIVCPFFFVKSSSATIDGHTINIVARVDGQIIQSYVQKDQEVKKGDVLFEIDSQEYQQELMKAQNDLEICKAKMAILTNQPYPTVNNQPGILTDNNLQKPLEQKSVNRFKSGENNYTKYSKAYSPDDMKPKQISPEQAQQLANNASQKSLQNFANSNSKLQRQKETNLQTLGDLLSNPSKIDVSKDTVDSVNDQINVLNSQIEELQLKLSYTRVCAPKDGTISSISAEQGYFIQKKENMCTLIPKQVWITAKFSQKNLDKVQIGQSVYIKMPIYRRRIFKGMVSSIDTVNVNNGEDEEVEVTPDNMGFQQQPVKKETKVKIEFIEDYSDFNIPPGTNVIAVVKVK